MKTPFGFDCPYFYGDYYRGKNQEECRLIGNQTGSQRWEVRLCENCPVPAIRRANACTFMVLTPVIKKSFFGKRKITVTAYCQKSESPVKTPEIGCGICHPLDELFTVKK